MLIIHQHISNPLIIHVPCPYSTVDQTNIQCKINNYRSIYYLFWRGRDFKPVNVRISSFILIFSHFPYFVVFYHVSYQYDSALYEKFNCFFTICVRT